MSRSTESTFDVVVIGAGAAGEVTAGRLGEAGLSVAIIEDHLVGGDCSFYACMPSKALLRPGEALAEALHVPGIVADPGLDSAAVLKRRDRIINSLDDADQTPWLKKQGVTLIRGHGRLAAERQVSVGDRVLNARTAVIIATGSRPMVPPVPGLTELGPWTTRVAATASSVPGRLLIIGGGMAGVEMAQAWSRLGTAVTIVQRGERLLTREEPFVGGLLRDALERQGMAVITGRMVDRAWRDGEGAHLEVVGGLRLDGDEILVATGRTSRTEGLGLEGVGIPSDRPIAVDDQMRAGGLNWLYAVGDVNGRSLLTHVGKHQARIAADVILGFDAHNQAAANDAQAPRVIFTDPQIAATGHTARSAHACGISTITHDLPTNGTAGGSFVGHGEPGLTRFVVDAERQVLVGATFVGSETGEWLHAATIAIVAEVPVATLWHAIAAFPTRSEIWLKQLEKAAIRGGPCERMPLANAEVTAR
jgi:dihydrolipoamide dehydrogenase